MDSVLRSAFERMVKALPNPADPSKKIWYILFRNGSFVRLEVVNDDVEDDRDYAGHGLHEDMSAEDQATQTQNNITNFQAEQGEDLTARVFRKGWHMLIAGGYPCPGNSPSDRSLYPLMDPDTFAQTTATGTGNFIAQWPNRDLNVSSLGNGTMMTAAVQAGKALRSDYIAPKIVAVYGPDQHVRKYD